MINKLIKIREIIVKYAITIILLTSISIIPIIPLYFYYSYIGISLNYLNITSLAIFITVLYYIKRISTKNKFASLTKLLGFSIIVYSFSFAFVTIIIDIKIVMFISSFITIFIGYYIIKTTKKFEKNFLEN